MFAIRAEMEMLFLQIMLFIYLLSGMLHFKTETERTVLVQRL